MKRILLLLGCILSSMQLSAGYSWAQCERCHYVPAEPRSAKSTFDPEYRTWDEGNCPSCGYCNSCQDDSSELVNDI